MRDNGQNHCRVKGFELTPLFLSGYDTGELHSRLPRRVWPTGLWRAVRSFRSSHTVGVGTCVRGPSCHVSPGSQSPRGEGLCLKVIHDSGNNIMFHDNVLTTETLSRQEEESFGVVFWLQLKWRTSLSVEDGVVQGSRDTTTSRHEVRTAHPLWFPRGSSVSPSPWLVRTQVDKRPDLCRKVIP